MNIPVGETLCVLFLTMTIIVGYAAYQSDSTLGIPVVRLLLRTAMYSCAGLVLYLLLLGSPNVSARIAVPIAYWLTVHIHTYARVSWDVLNLVLLVSLLMLDSALLRKLFGYYRVFLVAMAAVGIACYAAYALSLPLPYDIVKYYNRNDLYINYTVSFLYTTRSGLPLRLCGLFNEPGYFGTILALVLCADGLDLGKKSNGILLTAGCLTFSVAFFVLVAVYLMLRWHRKPWAVLLFVAAALFYLFVLPEIEFSDPNVADIVRRLTLVDGRLAGDNRVDGAVEAAFRRWLDSGKLLFGYGNGYAAMNGSALSYKTYLMDFGIVGFLLVYGPLLAAALKGAGKDRRAICFVICFFLSIYQRTGVYCLPYFVVLFGGIEWARARTGGSHG